MNRRLRIQGRSKIFAMGYLPVTIYGTATELRNLRAYLATISSYVTESGARFRKSIETEIARHALTGEHAESYYLSHEDEFQKWHSSFPETIRLSVLVAACTRLESSLANLCRSLEKDPRVNVKLKWGEIEDRGVRRATKFLRHNLCIHCEDHKAWTRILDYYQLRNCAAHAAGIVDDMNPEDQTKTRNAIGHLAKLGVAEDALGSLILPMEFLDAVILDMSDLWDGLAVALEENDTVGPVYWP